MIKFFRNIRQKLVSENKFSKYLLYAVGEIVLVVIGILIALSINNWNEWKKERALEQTILFEIVENLETNIEILESDIEYLYLLDTSSQIVLSHFQKTLPYTDSLAHHFHLARIPKHELFLSRTGYEGYKDIGFQIITSKVVKDEIISLFETIYPSMLSNYSLVNQYSSEFDNHVVQNFNYSDGKLIPNDHQRLLKDQYYISWIKAYKEGRKDIVKMERALINETVSVLHQLKKELK